MYLVLISLLILICHSVYDDFTLNRKPVVITTPVSHPEASTVAPPNHELLNDACACYGSLTEQQYFMATTHNMAFSNTPFYITVVVSFEIFKEGKETIISYATYYMILTGGFCGSTLEISNNNHQFDQMNLIVEIYLGYGHTLLTRVHVEFFPEIRPGINLYKDKYNIMSVYINYVEGINMLKILPYVPYEAVIQNVQRQKYNKPYICVANRYEQTVLKPEYKIKTESVPPYISITRRVYNSRAAVMDIELPAWPCDSDSLVTEYPPGHLVDVDLKTVFIFYTFNSFMENKLYQAEISRAELRNLTLFTTPDVSITNVINIKSNLSIKQYLLSLPYEWTLLECTIHSWLMVYELDKKWSLFTSFIERLVDSQEGFRTLESQETNIKTC